MGEALYFLDLLIPLATLEQDVLGAHADAEVHDFRGEVRVDRAVIDDEREAEVLVQVRGMNEILEQLAHGLNAAHLNMCAVRSHLVLVGVARIGRRKVLTLLLTRLILRCFLLVGWRPSRALSFLRIGLAISIDARLALSFWIDFLPSEILKVRHVLQSLESSVTEYLLQSHINIWKIVAQLFAQGSVAREVVLGEGVLKI